MIGDIVYSRNLPNSYRLECVVSGTSDSVEPTYSGPVAGQYIQDGTCIWIIDDIHDSQKIGDITFSYILRPGYIQANGALLPDASINYPRLINFLNNNTSLLTVDDTSWNTNKALYVYDSVNDTLRIPDAAGRVLQGGSAVESVDAGLPNITGDAAVFGLGSNLKRDTITYDSIRYCSSIRYGALDIVGPIGQSSTEAHSVSIVSDTNSRIFNQIIISARKSNSIYGNSTTVQPPALTLIPQIKY